MQALTWGEGSVEMSDCTRVPPRAWTLGRKSRKTTETAAPIENSLSLSKLRVVWYVVWDTTF
jgi:hypothetical protein